VHKSIPIHPPIHASIHPWLHSFTGLSWRPKSTCHDWRHVTMSTVDEKLHFELEIETGTMKCKKKSTFIYPYIHPSIHFVHGDVVEPQTRHQDWRHVAISTGRVESEPTKERQFLLCFLAFCVFLRGFAQQTNWPLIAHRGVSSRRGIALEMELSFLRSWEKGEEERKRIREKFCLCTRHRYRQNERLTDKERERTQFSFRPDESVEDQ
jgi:hypothetical protein